MSVNVEQHQDIHAGSNPQGTMSKEVQPLNYSSIDSIPETSMTPVQPPSRGKRPLATLFDIPITLVFEVGRVDISIRELMELKQGSMIDLRHVSVDSIDIRINNNIIGYGEAIGLASVYGIRFGELELFSQFDDIRAGTLGSGQAAE